jgi:hypothetical protein
MKKCVILLLLGCLLVASAQAQFAKPLKSRNEGKSNVGAFSIGITGSFAANDMLYSAVVKSKLTPYLAPTFGVAAEWNVMNGIAVGLDASYAMRGTNEVFATEFLTSYTTTTFARVKYAMTMNGVEVRIPLSYYIGNGEAVKPYVYIAPRFNFWLNGNVRWERSYDVESYSSLAYESELNKATTTPFDFGAVAGVGLCGRIAMPHMLIFVKFDLSYGIGALSSFSRQEVNETVTFQGWGDIEHETLGKRHLQDLEARLTLLMPLRKPLKDACAFNQKQLKGK